MDDDFAEAVLDVVEHIPVGQVASYGDIAQLLGRGGPRQVGHVMALHGAAVPWWRVVRSDGHPARGLESVAWSHLAAEGVPRRGERVDLDRARVEWVQSARP